MKVCKICNQEKPLSLFGKRATMKDGYKNDCKECEAKQATIRQRTKFGLFARLYSHQLESSRKRGHNKPEYTLNELRDKFINDDLFLDLYAKWVESDYYKYKTPSFDRLDNTKGYSFDNIQLVTWAVNDKLGTEYLKENPNSGNFKKGCIPWNKKQK